VQRQENHVYLAAAIQQPVCPPLQVTRLFTGYVGAMLRDYAANPAGAWKSKDCAIYLVVALAVRRIIHPSKIPCAFLLRIAWSGRLKLLSRQVPCSYGFAWHNCSSSVRLATEDTSALIQCIQVRGRTAAMGATHTNDLVNIAEFYQQQIVPDLQAPGDEVRRCS